MADDSVPAGLLPEPEEPLYEEDLDEEEAEAEGEDDGLELEIMDPDHPAMKRVQDALTRQLTSQIERLDSELYAKTGLLKDAERRREDTGVLLYQQQQLLAKEQLALEEMHDKLSQFEAQNTDWSSVVAEERAALERNEAEVAQRRSELARTRREADKLRASLLELAQSAEGVESNLKIAKLVAGKTTKEEAEVEAGKQRQDLYVDQLTEQRRKLENEIRVHNTQMEAQRELTARSLQRLNEAQGELEAVQRERRDIQQQWQLGLKGLTERNKMAASIEATCAAQEQELLAQGVELGNLAREVAASQAKNEELEDQFQRLDNDCKQYERQLGELGRKMDEQKSKFSTLTKTLKVTEEGLSRGQVELRREETQLAALRQQVEKQHRLRVDVEQSEATETFEQKTATSAGKTLMAAIKKAQARNTEQDAVLAKSLNMIARKHLEQEQAQRLGEELRAELAEVEARMKEKNALLAQYEKNARHNEIGIERTQSSIVLLQRKISTIMEARASAGAGRAEITPQELERDELSANIAAVQSANADRQQLWLQKQGTLVQLYKERDEQRGAIEDLKTRLTVMGQKRYRITQEMEANAKEHGELRRAFAGLQKDVVKLNTLIHANSGIESSLESKNALMEAEFLRLLRDEELASIQMQAQVEAKREERVRVSADVIEAERQILEHEKKIQLAKEMKETLTGGEDGSETDAMRREIHRMELRLSQLGRQKEALIQEMERAVTKRGDIQVTARSQKSRGVASNSVLKKQVAELRKRVAQTKKDIVGAEAEIGQTAADHDAVARDVDARRGEVAALHDRVEDLTREIRDKRALRARGLEEVLYQQKLYKHLSTVREKGASSRRTHAEQVALLEEAEDQLRRLNNIVEYFAETHPEVAPDVEAIRGAIAVRLDAQASK